MTKKPKLRPTSTQLVIYGAPGSPVAGSRWVRDYCCECAVAIRVHPGASLGQSRCNECMGVCHARHGRSGPRYDDDPSPAQETAVRWLEDGR